MRALGGVRLTALVGTGLVALSLWCDAGAEGDAPAFGASSVSPPLAPLDTDVFLAELHWETSGPPGIGQPTNLTHRPGYDNQPYFVPDGSGLWYTAIDEHDGQADIWRYDFGTQMVTRVTVSNPESEYSATSLPDGSGISAIRVEADSTQRLWRFDGNGENASVVLADVAPVGYHTWADEATIVMFVLGSPPTLQRADTRTGRAEVLTEDIGRSIQSIPNSSDVSYVQRHEDGSTTIMRLPGDGGPAVRLVDGVEGGDFHAWTPNGTLLMAHRAIIYAWSPEADTGWQSVADFSGLHLEISRLAVSPDGSQIAIVAEPAGIELGGA